MRSAGRSRTSSAARCRFASGSRTPRWSRWSTRATWPATSPRRGRWPTTSGTRVSRCTSPTCTTVARAGRTRPRSTASTRRRCSDRHAADLIELVNRALRGKKVAAGDLFAGGRAAADATVALMKATVTTLRPIDVIDAFNAVPARARVDHMWEVLDDRTVTCVARGALVLAAIWESAWREGGGAKIGDARLKQSRRAHAQGALPRQDVRAGRLAEEPHRRGAPRPRVPTPSGARPPPPNPPPQSPANREVRATDAVCPRPGPPGREG